MTIQVIVSSRALYEADTYIGDKGRIFYRESVGDLRLSDGITPGGIPLTGNSVTLIGDTEPLNPSNGTLWFNPATNQLKIYFQDDSSGWIDIAGSLQGLTSNNENIIFVDDGYNIIPEVDAGPSLGTPQKRFKSLHLSGNSLYIDDVRITVNQNNELMVFDPQDNLTAIHSKEIYLGDESDPIILRKNDQTDRLEMVLYSGSVSEEIYTVSIGYTGSQGDIGYTGSQGDIGYTGSQGDIGYTGSQGDIGYTGSKGQDGISGVDGFTGSQGYTGSQGDQGSAGSIGFTGSQGETGAALKIVGFVDTVEQLPSGYQGSLGDAYIVRSNQNLLVWDSQQWVNTGSVPGANVGLATRDTAGIVKIGENININNGTISVPLGAGINKVVDIPDVVDDELADGAILAYNGGAVRWETRALDLTDSVMDGGFY